MRAVRFLKFVKTEFLESIGRDLLERFVGSFADELRARGAEPPPAGLADHDFCREVARLVRRPEGLPPAMIEAVAAIENLATATGQERIEKAMTLHLTEQAVAGGFVVRPDSTHAEIALQAWFVAPDVVQRAYAEHRLTRLATFVYFGATSPVARTEAFALPGPEVLAAIERDLDEWFALHNRGHATAQVQVQSIDADAWFVVRHGDTYRRTASVKQRTSSMLHYRPAKDDVIVYSPERDEIRVHAGTKGERELYRCVFGRRLFGNDEHFCERKAYTLDPLRGDGPEALAVQGVDGLARVVLREVEVAAGTVRNEVVVRKADDLFATDEAVPDGGPIGRAVFDVFFPGSCKGQRVEIRPPNVLRLGRHADGAAVQRWLSARGFRTRRDHPCRHGLPADRQRERA